MLILLRQVLDELFQEWRRQAAVAALDKLDDRLLADIGLRRDQLPLLMATRRGAVDWSAALEPTYRPELQICG
jgi:uncharacterized protein YjiS (DUF1127 family)